MGERHAREACGDEASAHKQHKTVGRASSEHPKGGLSHSEHEVHDRNAETHVLVGQTGMVGKGGEQDTDVAAQTSTEPVEDAGYEPKGDNGEKVICMSQGWFGSGHCLSFRSIFGRNAFCKRVSMAFCTQRFLVSGIVVA